MIQRTINRQKEKFINCELEDLQIGRFEENAWWQRFEQSGRSWYRDTIKLEPRYEKKVNTVVTKCHSLTSFFDWFNELRYYRRKFTETESIKISIKE